MCESTLLLCDSLSLSLNEETYLFLLLLFSLFPDLLELSQQLSCVILITVPERERGGGRERKQLLSILNWPGKNQLRVTLSRWCSGASTKQLK